jgi:hypothetical protein
MNIVSDVTPNFATERAILKLVGGSITIDLSSMKRNYTENEMKHGICVHLQKLYTLGEILERYGVPERTLREYEDEILMKVRKFLGKIRSKRMN